MSTHTDPPARRALALAALTSACLVAALGLATDQASADSTARVQAGTLQITGDGAGDTLTLAQGATANALDVVVNGQLLSTFDRATFTAVAVDARGGNDTVSVQNMVPALENVTIDGGAGDDTLTGANGAETFIGGPGNDFVDGNIGADTAQLGTGNDTFQWDPGDGSDTVDGQSGKDALAFNGSNAAEKIDVTANGSRVRLHRDVAAITMDLNDIESADIRALGSADTITVGDLRGTDLDATNVNLAAADGDGDGSADTVIAQETDRADDIDVGSTAGNVVIDGPSGRVSVAGNEAANDNVTVAALGGADTINAGAVFTGPIPVTVDGGDGSDTTTYSGTNADDIIGLARTTATAVGVFTPTAPPVNNTGVEELLVKGLGGADTITGQNGIGTLTHLTVDGGSGDDTIAGGDGDDSLLGGAGDDFVDGNRGTDAAQLGGGTDTFEWDPGDGSDTVDGQGGSDALQFNGSNIGENIDVSANGPRVRVTRNVAAVTMDVNDVEQANVRTLGGADNVTVGDLTGTGLKTANVDLAAFDGAGDGSADTVTLNGSDRAERVRVNRAGSQVLTTGLAAQTTITGSEAANDVLRVNTLGGRDDVQVAPDVSTLITPVVDLGADQ
jgi:Ca2+-binding RTX toxin-like protein